MSNAKTKTPEPQPLNPMFAGFLRVILGVSLIATVVALTGEFFVDFLVYIAIPVLLLGYAFGFVTKGTLQVVFNGDFKNRVMKYVDELESQARSHAA